MSLVPHTLAHLIGQNRISGRGSLQNANRRVGCHTVQSALLLLNANA